MLPSMSVGDLALNMQKLWAVSVLHLRAHVNAAVELQN